MQSLISEPHWWPWVHSGGRSPCSQPSVFVGSVEPPPVQVKGGQRAPPGPAFHLG
jgi:hypothetical protein